MAEVSWRASKEARRPPFNHFLPALPATLDGKGRKAMRFLKLGTGGWLFPNLFRKVA